MPMRPTRREVLPLLAATPMWLRGSLSAQMRAAVPTAGAAIPGTPSSTKYPHASAYLRSLIADDQFPGAIVMIKRQGQPDFIDVAGWLDGERTKPMSRDGIFFLASLSKPITAVATIALMEQGKVKLDDPVDKWLPELANRKVLKTPTSAIDDTYPSPRPITVADLLAFRCGYGGDGPRGPFGTVMRTANTSPDRALTLSQDEFLQELNPIPLQYPPNGQWLYDVPADILGVLISRVSGQRYSAFLNEHVFGPLGMKDSGFYAPPEKASRVAHYPVGPKRDIALPKDPLFQSGAHGMVSTADDYMALTQMLLSNGEYKGKRIVKASNVEAMRVDRLLPEEHKAGGFLDRYPGRGFGWCGAVRTEALPIGPSVGSYNWAGASVVWMMVDYARKMTIVIMAQHPAGGPPPGAEQPTGAQAAGMAPAAGMGGPGAGPGPGQPSPGATGQTYLSQTTWNDLMQTEIYKDVM